MKIVISSADAFIHEQLAAMSKIDPCATRIDVSVNQRPIAEGDPIPNILSTGSEEVHLIEPGFSLHFSEGLIGRHWRFTSWTAENCLRLRIPFAGQAQHALPQARIADLGSRCTFIIQPANAGLTGVYPEGAVYRFCSLHVSETYLVERLGVPAAEWPRILASSWRRHETAFGHLDLGKAPLATAGRLFNLNARGAWRNAEVRAIGLELLRQLFEAWLGARESNLSGVRLRPSERDQLQRLRAIAEARRPNPVSMVEAGEITGLNKNKIHLGFKQIYGLSLRDYCFDLRMQLARQLLMETDASVAHIAEAAGFSEPTNFTAAFRKHFSMRPSDARRPGSPVSGDVERY